MSGTEDKLRGKFDEVTGKGKQALGGLTGDESTRAEGQADEVKGHGQQAVGNLKDAANDAKESIKDAFKSDNG